MTTQISQADARHIAAHLLTCCDACAAGRSVEVSADGRDVIFRYEAKRDPQNRQKLLDFGYRFSRDQHGDLQTARVGG